MGIGNIKDSRHTTGTGVRLNWESGELHPENLSQEDGQDKDKVGLKELTEQNLEEANQILEPSKLNTVPM